MIDEVSSAASLNPPIWFTLRTPYRLPDRTASAFAAGDLWAAA
jgi:hypothetical protein